MVCFPHDNLGRVESEMIFESDALIGEWLANEGFLPYPMHQGKRCQRPSPVVVTLSGRPVDFLEGRPRQVVGLLDGSGRVEKVSWLIKAPDGGTVTLEADGCSAGFDRKDVTLKEDGQ